MNEQEERTEWAIPAESCGYDVGPGNKDSDGIYDTVCDHKDNLTGKCTYSACPIKVTGAKEKVIGMIEAQKDWNPYPADVFLPKNDKQWKVFHAALKKGGIIGDGYLGCVARDAYNLALDRLVKTLREQKDMKGA